VDELIHTATSARARATSFDNTASAYEYGRPEYPAEALRWWIDLGAFPLGGMVLDLAAGTGKLTRSLIDQGCDVVAVEPLANMRAEFARVLPTVRMLDGTAEAIPLADHSIDSVFVAQAFHWFDAPAALSEIARVLKPGGGLGLVWNDDDLTVPWVAMYSDRKHRSQADDMRIQEVATPAAEHPQFVNFVDFDCSWTQATSRARLLANVISRSYVSVLPPHERQPILDPIEALLGEQPEPVLFPHTTYATWCTTTLS
jgi:ubiquinone/menaquinone biosynthesis C-methylase UbiE